jgi:hypothetical protein
MRGLRGLVQKSVHDIIRGVNHPLNLAVLGRSVGTIHAELNTPREKEGARGVVIELTPVVALDSLDGDTELSGHPGKEVEKGGKSLGLGTQRKSPRVVREIIDHYQIILIARNARNRGSPHITVDKSKGMWRMGTGRRKGSITWQPN